MKLYLVRHGDAVSEAVDPERPLSGKGTDGIRRLGAFLKGKITVRRIFHSGKTRARQTAEILKSETAPQIPLEALGGILPMDSPEPFAKVLKDWEEDTLVVSHQPFLGSLVSFLITGNGNVDTVYYQTGSLVGLERSGNNHWVIFLKISPDLV